MSANLDSNNLQGTWTTASAPGQSLPLWLYRRLLRTFQTFPTAGMNGGRDIVQTQYNITIDNAMLAAVYGAFITLPPHLLRRLREMPEADMQPRPGAAVGGIMQQTMTAGNSVNPSTTDSSVAVSDVVADTTTSRPLSQPRIAPSTRPLDINALLSRPAAFPTSQQAGTARRTTSICPPSQQTGTARRAASGVRKQPAKTNQRRTRTRSKLPDTTVSATSSSEVLIDEPRRSPPTEPQHIQPESPGVTTNDQNQALLSNTVVYQTQDDDTGLAISLEDSSPLPLPFPEPLLRTPDTPIYQRQLESPVVAANDQAQAVLSETVIHQTQIDESEPVAGLDDPYNQRPLPLERPLRTPPLPVLEREDPESLFIPEEHRTDGSEPAMDLDDALSLRPFSPERPLRTPSPVGEDEDENSIFVSQGSRQRARQDHRHRASSQVPNNDNRGAEDSSLSPVLEQGPDQSVDQLSQPNPWRGLDGHRSSELHDAATPTPALAQADMLMDGGLHNDRHDQGTARQDDESHSLDDLGTPTPIPVQRLADEYHTSGMSSPNISHNFTTSFDNRSNSSSISSGQLSSIASLPLDDEDDAHWGDDETSPSGNELSTASDQETSSTQPPAELNSMGTPSVDNIILMVDDNAVVDGSDAEMESDQDTVSDPDIDMPDADDIHNQGGSDPEPDVQAPNAGPQTENPEPPLQPGALSRDPYGTLMVLRRLRWNGELRWVPAPREHPFSPPRQPRPVPPEESEWRDYPGIVAAMRRLDANIAARRAREARQAAGDTDDGTAQGNDTVVVTQPFTSNDDESGRRTATRTAQHTRNRATPRTPALSRGRRRPAGPTRRPRPSAGRTTDRQNQASIDHARAAAEQRALQANENRQRRLERRRRPTQEMQCGSDADADADEDEDCGDEGR
jgi:hypothetical protein